MIFARDHELLPLSFATISIVLWRRWTVRRSSYQRKVKYWHEKKRKGNLISLSVRTSMPLRGNRSSRQAIEKVKNETFSGVINNKQGWKTYIDRCRFDWMQAEKERERERERESIGYCSVQQLFSSSSSRERTEGQGNDIPSPWIEKMMIDRAFSANALQISREMLIKEKHSSHLDTRKTQEEIWLPFGRMMLEQNVVSLIGCSHER